MTQLFQPPKLGPAELDVLRRIDQLQSTIQMATGGFGKPRRWLGTLRSMAQAKAIQGSNSIEGYRVSIEDAIAAVEGEELLDASEESRLAVEGYQAAMTYVLRLVDDPHFSYSTQLLKSLQFMMLRHKGDKNPGLWRPGAIHVAKQETGEIVYEGPDIELVPGLMDSFVDSLAAPSSPSVLIDAAMAHLNLVMIHPFSDGNGRMARCIQTLVLVRSGAASSAYWSIEEYLGAYTSDYYDVLAKVGNGVWSPDSDTRPWIRFCLTAHFRQATTMVRRIEEMTRLWEYLDGLAANLKFPERANLALADAAMGYRVRNSTYRSRADITKQVASRDLTLLVSLGLLIPHGEKRGRTYVGAPSLTNFFGRLRAARKSIPDPFGDK